MKYVLIFMLITDGVGSFGFTAEFDDKAACLEALGDMENARLHSLDMGMRYNASVHRECYPKGSE